MGIINALKINVLFNITYYIMRHTFTKQIHVHVPDIGTFFA